MEECVCDVGAVFRAAPSSFFILEDQEMDERRPCKREGCPGLTPYNAGRDHAYCCYVCQHIDRELNKMIHGAKRARFEKGFLQEFYAEAHLLLLQIAEAQDAYRQHIENRTQYMVKG